MKARNLNILDINDQRTETFVSGAEHFNVRQIITWREVQSVLAGRILIPPPDLLLLDVSFDRDEDVKSATIGENSELLHKIVPIGPILALPFLNTQVIMGFSPYSAHLDNDSLMKYPPFLVAMGLIAAKIESGVFTSAHLSQRKTDTSLDNFLKDLKKKRAGNTNQALKIALELYRENFLKAVKGNRLLVINSKEIIDALSDLQEKIELSKKPEVEIPSEMGIEVMDTQYDCLRIVSLFADKVHWSGRWVGEKSLDEIYEWVKEIVKSEAPFAKAIRAIEKQDKIEETEDERPRIDNVIAEMYPLSSEIERREIFRLCVLFANVHALSLYKGQSFRKKDIFGRLGTGVEQNTYLSWFGKRNRTAIPIVNPLPVLNILPLSLINNSLDTSEIDSYFLSKGTVISHDDDSLIKKYRWRYRDADRAGSDYFEQWNCPYTVE